MAVVEVIKCARYVVLCGCFVTDDGVDIDSEFPGLAKLKLNPCIGAVGRDAPQRRIPANNVMARACATKMSDDGNS